MLHISKVQISFEEFEQFKNIKGMEIKDESRVDNIFNNPDKNSHVCKLCGENHLPYPRTTSEKYAEQLGDREIHPVLDFKQLAKLNIVRKAFQNKLDEEGKVPLGFIGPGIVDKKLSIIVVIPNETHNCLPATFEGYPVLIKYGVVKPASNPRAYHQILKPGISIGCSEGYENACTLEVFFQKRNMDKFLLTTGHAVGEVFDMVVQPERYENV